MNKPIRNYEKLAQLYGQDRATGEFAESASEMRERLRASNINFDVDNTVDSIDNLVSQNEVTLENFVTVDENNFNIRAFGTQS